MYELQDTITAIATPAGVGGIGIIRLSGDKAFEIAQKLLPEAKPFEKRRQILFTAFQHPQTGESLDEGLLLIMPNPQSYTTEDVVEFHVHGSPLLLEKMIELLAGLGARLAHPGEFTYRAFIHGRLDLTQAEAVESLVSAQGDASRRQALRQLTGGLAAHLEPMEEFLKSLYLKIEARLEFADDGIPPLDQTKFEEEAAAVRAELQKLLDSYQQGKVLREGLTVALVGPPNVGKSSLLNTLLGTQRAIVTPLAGTTRDVVEGDIRLKGVRVRFFDTAGLRDTKNVVEIEGIRRSRQVMEEADMIFWLIDASNPAESLSELKTASLPKDRVWYLFNKVDLVSDKQPWKKIQLPVEKCLSFSCMTREGLFQVFSAVESFIQTPSGGEDVVLTSARHRQEIEKALVALNNLQALMKIRQPFELWAEELKIAALAIGRIRGRDLPTKAFEDIFNKFCVGK
ncbi:MAG TPA: tRNA uridine-5-carboxymethylaminomethyl(34) synthesis GTPase MnmE [bacterium]|nr:tRNA uridine-5-carboxymethylaminomethyl(34) synthesis GTPase MnmE [bacterium]